MITSINNLPIRVEDVVEGGPLRYPEDIGKQGVVVGHMPRLGRVAMSHRQLDETGREVLDKNGDTVWINEPEKVQGIVLLRKGEASLPALHDVEAKIESLNADHTQLLPGVQIEPYYDRSELIGVTTETVHENLIVGMVLGHRNPADVSQQRAQRVDRGDQYSAGAVVRLLRCCSCAANRRTCCRSGRSTSASSSTLR